MSQPRKPVRHWYDADLGSGVLHCQPGQVRYMPPDQDPSGLVDASQPEPHRGLERAATIATAVVVAVALLAVFIAAAVLGGGS